MNALELAKNSKNFLNEICYFDHSISELSINKLNMSDIFPENRLSSNGPKKVTITGIFERYQNFFLSSSIK